MTIAERLAAKEKPTSKTDYPVNPVSELFPVMEPEAYEALKADIASHGQSEPIILWKKQLIDGRHRLRACKELGVKPIVVGISDSDDPLAYVISHNLYRRHLSTSERAMIAAKITTMKVGDNQHAKKEGPHLCGGSTKEAAAIMSVSTRSVENAKQVLEHGSKAVKTAVAQGKLKVTTAAELATSGATKSEQTQAVKGGKEAIKGVLKKPAKKEKSPLSKEEQVKANRKLVTEYIAKAVNAIDDYHAVKPHQNRRAEVVKLLQQAGEKLW